MWMKRKHGLTTHLQPLTDLSCDNSSWEEQAFAEDAAGPLGGCIWPPRSYSCSFCRREFRSAQALGGHMNVHRRDRARLKQSPIPHDESLNQNHIEKNPCRSFGIEYPSQVCTLVYNPNMKPNPTSHPAVLSSHSLPSRVFSTSNISNSVEKRKRSTLLSSSPPFDLEKEGNKSLKPDSSISLNLVLCRTLSTESSKDEADSCKKRKTDSSSLPIILSPSSFELSPNSLEELDLELRLGDRPKVK